MLVHVRRLLIIAALASWGLLVVHGAAVYEGFAGHCAHTAPIARLILWTLPSTLSLHAIAIVVMVVRSDWRYARAWTVGLAASASGQVAAWLVLLAVANTLEKHLGFEPLY